MKMGFHALATCLLAALGGNSDLVAFPIQANYTSDVVQPYNLDYPVRPAVVTFPQTAEQVAAIVRCAVESEYKVQPKSGGHSYGNYGLNLLSHENDIILIPLKDLLLARCRSTSKTFSISLWMSQLILQLSVPDCY